MEGRIFSSGPNGAAIQIEQAGRRYPMQVSPKCKTCHHPQRVQIEQMLLKSYGYAAICRSVTEGDELSVDNLRNHRNHMTPDQAVHRAAIEAHAQEMGLDIEGHEAMLANHITFLKVGVQKVFQRLMDGELEPDLDHGIAFANALLKVEEQAGADLDREVLNRAFMAQWEAIRSVCTPEQMQSISARISGDPVMKALTAQAEREAIIDVDEVS